MTNTNESSTDTSVEQTETTATNTEQATEWTQPETTDNSNEGQPEKKGSKGVEKLLAKKNEAEWKVTDLESKLWDAFKEIESLKLQNELTKIWAKYWEANIDTIAWIAADKNVDVETAALIWKGMNPTVEEKPKVNPNQYGMGWNSNSNADQTTITKETLSWLSQWDYNTMMEKINNWQVKLVA